MNHSVHNRDEDGTVEVTDACNSQYMLLIELSTYHILVTQIL